MQLDYLIEDVPPVRTKRVAVTLGRFQPPTVGHYKVISKMAEVIRTYNKEHKLKLEVTPVVIIVVGKETSKDKVRNPLSYGDIVRMMKASGKMDEKTIYLEANSAFDAFVQVRQNGMEPTLVFGGSDRGTGADAPYKDILDQYFNDGEKKLPHEYVSIPRANSGDLTDNEQVTLLKGIETDGSVDPKVVSGTLARKAVALDMHKAFAIITGLTEKVAKIMFRKIKNG